MFFQPTPKPLHPVYTGLYVANLQGVKTKPKPLHSPSILCCMFSTYTTLKPLYPFYTGLYVANLQGLKPPQSSYILETSRLHPSSIACCMFSTYTKATTSRLYRAVCCQPTGRENQTKAATFPFYTMLHVFNLHHPKATVSLLYRAVCCQPPQSHSQSSLKLRDDQQSNWGDSVFSDKPIFLKRELYWPNSFCIFFGQQPGFISHPVQGKMDLNVGACDSDGSDSFERPQKG